MWTTLQIIFGLLGILLAFGGDRFSMPIFTNLGIACFGLASIAIGWEAILTRHIKLGSRRRGTRETYTGPAAVLQGIQFNLLGLSLIGLGLFFDFSAGREVFLQFVRRPGIPLAVIGLLMLLQSIIMFLGYRELNEGPGWLVMMNRVLSRMLPGVILLLLGFGALGLGLLEFIAPNVFDEMGGGFLETLYGLR